MRLFEVGMLLFTAGKMQQVETDTGQTAEQSHIRHVVDVVGAIGDELFRGGPVTEMGERESDTVRTIVEAGTVRGLVRTLREPAKMLRSGCVSGDGLGPQDPCRVIGKRARLGVELSKVSGEESVGAIGRGRGVDRGDK